MTSKTRLRQRVKAEQERLSAERGRYVPLEDVPVLRILEELERKGEKLTLKDINDILDEEEPLSPALFETDDLRKEQPLGPRRRAPVVRREDIIEGMRRARDNFEWLGKRMQEEGLRRGLNKEERRNIRLRDLFTE
jgi:hypothetical protein